ncbi:MAG: hypothetical protein KAU28_07815, partial [Phycisphaerae bacterium]|nr:hypothetical protein [Phycisphaerae bacterium]
MNTRNAAILTCILCISLPAAGQYPLADRVPAESIGYIGWAGRSLTFDGSMVGQLIGEPALTSMLGALREATVKGLGDTALRKEGAEHIWDIATIAWQHPIAVAVLPPAEAGPPMPNPVMIVDLGEDRESFAEHLDGMLVAFEAEVEEVLVGPLTCKMVQTGGPPLVFGYVGNLLVVTMDPELILRVSQLAEAESLQAEPKFIDAMAAVAGDNMQLAAYVDFTALRETINSFMPPPPEEPQPHEAALNGAEEQFARSGPAAIFNSRDIHSFWRALGVDETTALAYSTRIVDRQLYTKIRLLSPGPHQGYLMLFAGQPITDEDLAGLPGDADLVAVANLSPTDVLAEVRRSMREIWPAFGEEGS